MCKVSGMNYLDQYQFDFRSLGGSKTNCKHKTDLILLPHYLVMAMVLASYVHLADTEQHDNPIELCLYPPDKCKSNI